MANVSKANVNKANTNKQTRYCVISTSTGKTLKNCETRESARLWKRSKNGLSIFDRKSDAIIH